MTTIYPYKDYSQAGVDAQSHEPVTQGAGVGAPSGIDTPLGAADLAKDTGISLLEKAIDGNPRATKLLDMMLKDPKSSGLDEAMPVRIPGDIDYRKSPALGGLQQTGVFQGVRTFGDLMRATGFAPPSDYTAPTATTSHSAAAGAIRPMPVVSQEQTRAAPVASEDAANRPIPVISDAPTRPAPKPLDLDSFSPKPKVTEKGLSAKDERKQLTAESQNDQKALSEMTETDSSWRSSLGQIQ